MIGAAGSTRGARIALVALVLIGTGCTRAFTPKYEYEEEIYLRLDGSAVVYVNASAPALVALRGLDVPLDPAARLDRDRVRALYASPETDVENLTTSRRDGRRYIHLRLAIADVRRLDDVAPFAWSSYVLREEADDALRYEQHVGAATNASVGDVGWTGEELVAFRLHLPSRVSFHNAPSGRIERGNILVWEQRLDERLAGRPLAMAVTMDEESILASTLTLFGVMAALALLTLAVVWQLVRRGGTREEEREARIP